MIASSGLGRARLGLAALSGLLLALSFPKFGHWAVAWLALVPLLVALREATPREGALLGYVTGVVSAVGLLYWTSLVVVQFGGLALPLAALVMVLLCLAVALFCSLFGALVALWSRRWGRKALLLAPLAWVASEILRAHTLYRFAWCLLGYSQQENLALIQIASVTAVYGVSFLVAATSATAAYVLCEPRRPARVRAAAACLALVAGAAGYGAWALSRPVEASGRIRVGLVQAAIPQDEKWDPARARENIERHVALTREAAARGARLVVWPESAVPYLYDQNPGLARQLQALAQETGVYLFFGNDDVEIGASPRYFVGAKLLEPDGALSFRYHKIRLVPFGEYVPLQPLLTLGGRYAARLVHAVSDFSPGREARVGVAAGHRFGAFICYEAIFPDLVRQFANGGAELLVNVTNDAWYGRSSAPHQHFAMAAFRAVENGKPLLRAANTGITAVVDARGRVLERTRLFERGVLVRDVDTVAGASVYARHGDVFGWSCFAAAAGLTALALARRG